MRRITVDNVSQDAEEAAYAGGLLPSASILMRESDDLVTTDWLAAKLSNPHIRVIDATWFLPSAGVDPVRAFEEAHIPGAVFFDIDGIADRDSELPHMLPPVAEFAEHMAGLGIANDHHVVVYDAHGLFSAPRAWWSLRAFGHDRVCVLDGGLPKWRRDGYPLAAGPASPQPAAYAPKRNPSWVASSADVLATIGATERNIIDARGRGRFLGREQEPRPGLRSGHIPGSKNVPHAELLNPDGTMKQPADLAGVFQRAEVDPMAPAICTCGSGITACVVAFALHRLSNQSVAVYDGAWTEWGARTDWPVQTSA